MNAKTLGEYLRARREALHQTDRRYSLRQTAQRVGIAPAYLSNIERDQVPPPATPTLVRLARDLDEDIDVVLAMAGKVSESLQLIILQRPVLFSELLREIRHLPDEALLRIIREVQDGKW